MVGGVGGDFSQTHIIAHLKKEHNTVLNLNKDMISAFSHVWYPFTTVAR